MAGRIRTYIVQELRRPWICHVTYPNGDYKRIDTGTASRKGLRGAVGNLPLKVARGRNGRSAARLAEVDASYTSPTDRPELCLIGLNRVMQITGFKKTFIYDQLALGFPAPVRLGDSRRAAARWIEAEVFQWVRQLADKRVAKVSSV